MNAVQSFTVGSAPAALRHARAGSGAVMDGASVARYLRDSSLNRALDVLGDWWTQCILRESFLRVRNFDEFQSRLAIPRQTLARRLRALVEHGIFDASRGGYRLTTRGLALYPWALMVWRWSHLWTDAPGVHLPALVHLDCGRPTSPVFACGACRQQATLRDIAYQALAPVRRAASAATDRLSGKRWTGDRFLLDAPQTSRHVAYVTADRWSHLILSAVFLGCRTFDRLQREVGISPNILSRRLALLLHTGFLTKQRSTQDGRRFDYRLTPRSRDVFPVNIALIQWANTYLPSPQGPPLQRFHRACGQPFHGTVICSHCKGELLPSRVSFNTAASSAAALHQGDT